MNCYKTTDRKHVASNKIAVGLQMNCAECSALGIDQKNGQKRRATALDTSSLRLV